MLENSVLDITQKVIESEDDVSDASLKIIEEQPKTCKKSKSKKLNEEQLIDEIESDFDKTLDEKAAKRNLSKVNIKSILKQVVTNEHVLALVRQVENPKENISLQFEPKLTRAKKKELYPSQAWVPPASTLSETQVLISDELQGDSSGDEYIPGEESEDDRDSSILSESEILSVGPPTPQSADCSTQTTWTEDGMFKVPATTKTKEEVEEEANIARRTRSKLCLSDTPLEVIEEAFIPPDITTDMYDLECDDDDWKHFLTQFTRPLDEVTKVVEDEDHDPEYNVLADEEMDKVDKEELRADKGVKVTRKELNELMTELLEYTDNFTNEEMPLPSTNLCMNKQIECEAQHSFLNQEIFQITSEDPKYKVTLLDESYLIITDDQKALLAQQMRQHVQMLTQNFMLTYEIPELHDMSKNFKEYLLQINNLSYESSLCTKACNLEDALVLIQNWETKINSNDAEVKKYKDEVSTVAHKVREAKYGGLSYVPAFPKLLMEVVSKSTVFLYTASLPRIPFKTAKYERQIIVPGEVELIAFGLEQFIPFLNVDKVHVGWNGETILSHACDYISKYLVPCKTKFQIYRYLCKYRRSPQPNAIKYYFESNKVSPIIHYVVPLQQLQLLPPCKRPAEFLPELWKNFVYPPTKVVEPLFATPIYLSPITKVIKPPLYNKTFARKRRIAPKFDIVKRNKINDSTNSTSNNNSTHNSTLNNNDTKNCTLNNTSIFASTPISKQKPSPKRKLILSKEILNFKFNSAIFSKANMLPSMPSLGTPQHSSLEPETSYDFIISETIKKEVIEDRVEVDEPMQKDNLDDINALVLASSTIKTMVRKRQTVSEKKKAKMKREFDGNLRMLSDEDQELVDEKTNRFVQAFYDKVQEQLELHDYHRFMGALNDFDEKHNSVTELYKKVEDIIMPKHPDLCDEFLTFFTALQAKKMGKLVPYLMMNHMSLFLRKLEMYFKDQPSQVRKIYRCLTELVGGGTVQQTMAQVKSTILPLLKGNGLLLDWFLQIFPTEKPTERMLNNSWESIEIGKENSINQEECFETITVPEIEDPYGGPNCICSCHSVSDPTFQTRARHCIPCGTKFLQGRVFVQTGKGLRLAKVSFNDNSVDHVKRLTRCTKNKIGTSKQISPGKDSQDENRLSSDDELDKKQQRIKKAAKKRKPKKKVADATCAKPVKIPTVVPVAEVNPAKEELIVKIDAENISDSSLNETKPAENVEWDCNTSIESIELKMSPEHVSAESESEFCETSQDNNTDTDVSEPELNSPNSPGQPQWSRDEDKTILETFQKEALKEEAFQRIATVLENRSVEQIKMRFEVLINLLKEMSRK